MKRILSTVFAAAMLVASATPAIAAPPDGACPPSFTEATFDEMLATFPQVPEAFGVEAALAGLMRFDNNGNEVVCWIAHPTNSKVYETKVFVANVIDDNAVGLE